MAARDRPSISTDRARAAPLSRPFDDYGSVIGAALTRDQSLDLVLAEVVDDVDGLGHPRVQPELELPADRLGRAVRVDVYAAAVREHARALLDHP
ncbi:hypothetical protein [Halopiger xanaduensis]|uniref:hypothetical protein n=1 Tax=Halopiger xanaduensis TaxID=387343 RepID=UPI000677BCE2|nr:hypothetical protein [Halopiger xanaduensis]